MPLLLTFQAIDYHITEKKGLGVRSEGMKRAEGAEKAEEAEEAGEQSKIRASKI